ncbi:hypothetical protein ACUWEX_01165 [Okibacterium fritillariae]|uniref:Uncharacterized protein n=1 Tax=Okibacterium fritillariae TaxID=123320 RepID=A0A1T5IC24_9MICO|nr:cytochrome d ubiquinol oxidase subunit II [Okibacterium fritillariae]SKC36552.1 hypothetical protein SAMN06309945_0215 [Okibacterium fritillariae]
MPEGRTLAVSRLRLASVVLSIVALVFFAMAMLLSSSRVAFLVGPVVLGAVALVLALMARGSAVARPGPVIAFMLATLAMIVPAVVVGSVIYSGAAAPSSVYMIEVDSPDPVDVVIRDGADRTSVTWDSGNTITLDSNATVIGINARTAVSTTVISCEIRRDGTVLVADERAGTVDCSFVEGDD